MHYTSVSKLHTTERREKSLMLLMGAILIERIQKYWSASFLSELTADDRFNYRMTNNSIIDVKRRITMTIPHNQLSYDICTSYQRADIESIQIHPQSIIFVSSFSNFIIESLYSFSTLLTVFRSQGRGLRRSFMQSFFFS